MKMDIKVFLGFRWIGTRRSKFAKIRVFKVDNFILPLLLVGKKSEKKEKNYMGVFSTHFVALISSLAPKIMEE